MKKTNYIHDREIHLVNLDPTKGIEMQKVRPCLVLRKYNDSHLIILPLSTKKGFEDVEFELSSVKGLNAEKSYVKFSQVRTVDSSRFMIFLGKISENKFFSIRKIMEKSLTTPPQVLTDTITKKNFVRPHRDQNPKQKMNREPNGQ